MYRLRSVEARDLLLSWAALTVAFGARHILSFNPIGIALSAFAVATAFVVHELAHRTVAVRRGFLAMYRAWYPGLIFAVALALVTAASLGRPIVFAVPGSVVVFRTLLERGSYRDVLRIVEAGPASNIVVAYLLWLVAHGVPYPYKAYLYVIADVNAWIAFFNLLPIPPLDGSKIVRFSVIDWVVLVVLAGSYLVFM